MREVRLAVVEHDGSVSLLMQSWAEPAQKADVLAEQQQIRSRTLGDQDEPPPLKRTDSRQALCLE
jgi:uncharacterized membrane protein YcaP (DUF421 family)